jgi:hypothetical protein
MSPGLHPKLLILRLEFRCSQQAQRIQKLAEAIEGRGIAWWCVDKNVYEIFSLAWNVRGLLDKERDPSIEEHGGFTHQYPYACLNLGIQS